MQHSASRPVRHSTRTASRRDRVVVPLRGARALAYGSHPRAGLHPRTGHAWLDVDAVEDRACFSAGLVCGGVSEGDEGEDVVSSVVDLGTGGSADAFVVWLEVSQAKMAVCSGRLIEGYESAGRAGVWMG